MTQMWGDANPEEVKRTWSLELGRFDPEDIRNAIDATNSAHQDYPPTLWQFVSLCKDSRAKRAQQSQKLDGPKTEMPDEVRSFLTEFVRRHKAA